MRKRFWLYLVLVACCLLVWARVRQPVAAGAQTASSYVRVPLSGRNGAQGDAPLTEKLPVELSRNPLEPASRDPFSGTQPVQEPIAPPPRQIVMAPLPSAPQFELVFAGRMTSPDGQQTIFARHGSETLSLAEGKTLSNGYRVLSITDQAVEFEYPPLNTKARLELPPAPMQEIR